MHLTFALFTLRLRLITLVAFAVGYATLPFPFRYSCCVARPFAFLVPPRYLRQFCLVFQLQLRSFPVFPVIVLVGYWFQLRCSRFTAVILHFHTFWMPFQLQFAFAILIWLPVRYRLDFFPFYTDLVPARIAQLRSACLVTRLPLLYYVPCRYAYVYCRALHAITFRSHLARSCWLHVYSGLRVG